jgi:hypothetical protein
MEIGQAGARKLCTVDVRNIHASSPALQLYGDIKNNSGKYLSLSQSGISGAAREWRRREQII